MSAPPKALLDTDTVSLLIRRDPVVRENAKRCLARHQVLSFSKITRYEVVRGLLAVRASSRLTMFAQVCDTCEVIPVDWSVLERAATIWADLRRQGRMIEETDILIAASALCRNWAIVSHNTRHFQPVSGLTVIDWTLQGT